MTQTTYMGTPVGKPAGLIITALELKRLFQEPLKGGCIETDSRYKCVVAYQGKRYTFDKHDTIDECNAQYEKQLKKIKAKVIRMPQKAAPRGYRMRKLEDGSISYDVSIVIKGERVSLGMYKSKEKARDAYMEAHSKKCA